MVPFSANVSDQMTVGSKHVLADDLCRQLMLEGLQLRRWGNMAGCTEMHQHRIRKHS